MGDNVVTFAVPGRLVPGAQALAAPAMPPTAPYTSLPTRFPVQDGDSGARSAGFRSPDMALALDGRGTSGDAQVATSAQTLLGLGVPGVGTTQSKQGAVAAAHKKRRVESDGGRRWTAEFAAAEVDDARGSGSESGGEEGAMTTSSTKSDEVVEKQRKRPLRIRNHRKATHTVRKEEKDRLQKELDVLNDKMVELQRRALNLAADGEGDQSVEETITSRNVLCHLLRRQQLEFATIRKLVTESTASVIRGGSPIQRKIHLTEDFHARRDLLASVKASKLKDGREFLRNRLPDVDLGAPMDEDFRFESPEGDFYACQFTIIQFESMQSARQVFDQLLYYLCNVEISISEKVGHLTIREDDDVAADGIVQNKIVSTTVHGIKMESNAVMFSEFYDRTVTDRRNGVEDEQGGEFGVIVTDFVDEDDRHPYLPKERIRKDVSNVMEVRPYWRSRPDGQREQVVVLIRWAHSRLRHPEFAVSRVAWLDLRDNMDVWSKNMHKVIMESTGSSGPTSSGAPMLSNAQTPLFHRPREFPSLPWT